MPGLSLQYKLYTVAQVGIGMRFRSVGLSLDIWLFYLSVCLYMIVFPSVSLSMSLPLFLSLCLSLCFSDSLSPSVSFSVSLSPSVYLSVCLSVCLSVPPLSPSLYLSHILLKDILSIAEIFPALSVQERRKELSF